MLKDCQLRKALCEAVTLSCAPFATAVRCRFERSDLRVGEGDERNDSHKQHNRH